VEPILYEDRPLEGGQLLGYLVGIISRDGALKIGPIEEGLTLNRIEDYLARQIVRLGSKNFFQKKYSFCYKFIAILL
jgi:hypothetical protein